MNDPAALLNRGNTLLGQGRLAEAEASYRRLLAIQPNNAAAHGNLGVALRKLGRHAEAEACYRRVLAIRPGHAGAHCNLGNLLQDLGRPAEAEACYRKALAIQPGLVESHSNLGNVLRSLGRLEEAEASLRRAIEIRPGFAAAHNNLGNVLAGLGRPEEAEACYRRALAIAPDDAEGHYNLGNVLKDLGRLDEAEAAYRRAIELRPDHARACSNLGIVLRDLGRPVEAEASYRRAIAIRPGFAEAHGNLGGLFVSLKRFAEAEACYRHAIEIRPDDADSHAVLGGILKRRSDPVGAEASYREAMRLQPEVFEHAVNAHLSLPVIPASREDIAFWRERYRAGIAALMEMDGSLEDPGKGVKTQSFYLAYHDEDDRPLMESLCHLFRAKSGALGFASPHLSEWRPPSESGRHIRVGFLSQLLSEHTIGKLYQGLIRHLDRDRFEVVVIHTPEARRDGFRERLDGLADRALTLPPELAAQQRAVADERLDVLFYPDIGMSSTYYLAYARLAPVQAVSWGHPDTTGLDGVDYFVSGDAIEPADADRLYTERLVRLGRLPCFYDAPAPASVPPRADLGLPETGTLYGCPQSLFKFHPDFDAVLAAIAEGDPTGRIVVIGGEDPVWADRLRARWARDFPALAERVLFLDRLSPERFMALCAHLDVLLDPVHFGSGNTLYEAMVYGTPVVTWPGRFMRGRIVSGGYRQMGVADAPVVGRIEDYAPLALALGRDPERLGVLRATLREAASRELFADLCAVREFEAFLEASVKAAGRGERLPQGWRPEIHS